MIPRTFTEEGKEIWWLQAELSMAAAHAINLECKHNALDHALEDMRSKGWDVESCLMASEEHLAASEEQGTSMASAINTERALWASQCAELEHQHYVFVTRLQQQLASTATKLDQECSLLAEATKRTSGLLADVEQRQAQLNNALDHVHLLVEKRDGALQETQSMRTDADAA